jgi:DNA-binding NarL/FixJ family response regulator/signal transduction histidine kinase
MPVKKNNKDNKPHADQPADGELRRKMHELHERVKELNCLYSITNLRDERQEASLEELLRGVADVIPPGWQYPEITAARITLDGKAFKTSNFRETKWMQSAELIVWHEPVGFIEVCYLKEKPDAVEGPFLGEERNLLNAIAERVSRMIEHKRTEAKVQDYQSQLRALASELSLTEERERRRIACELHDHIGHNLAIAKVKLAGLKESCADCGMDDVLALLDKTIQDTRSLTFELSPPVLHELGFEPALEWLVNQMSEDHGVNAELSFDRRNKPLTEDTRIVLFQAVRELLTNVTKHAQAEKVDVYVRRVGAQVQVVVEDDGVGFDPSEVAARRGKAGGFGIFSIRERLSYLGGSLEVLSEHGHGTRITMTAPLNLEAKSQTNGAKAESSTGQVGDGRRIRILLADDQQITREGLRALLEKHEDMEVIAEASDGRQAIQLSRELVPDVVVMDVAMQGLNGIEATRQIVGKIPGVKVVALSMHADGQFVLEMLRAGASGYLLKDCAQGDLARAIRTVDANLTFLSPGIADSVVGDYARLHGSGPAAITILTEREREVLQLLAEGKNTKEIALHFKVSVKTVETHRQHIMEKLAIHSVAELTKFAIREGLTGLEP